MEHEKVTKVVEKMVEELEEDTTTIKTSDELFNSLNMICNLTLSCASDQNLAEEFLHRLGDDKICPLIDGLTDIKILKSIQKRINELLTE